MIKLNSEWVDSSLTTHEVVGITYIDGSCNDILIIDDEGYTQKVSEDSLLKYYYPCGEININSLEYEDIGKHFVEWLILERKFQESLSDMYRFEFSHISSDDDLDKEFEDKNKPEDKTAIVENIKVMQDCLLKQQEAYDKLYELSDLKITKNRLGNYVKQRNT